MRSRLNTMPFGITLMLALLVRLLLFPIATYWYDMNAFREWSHFFSQNPLSAFYSSASLGTAPDHLPGDLLIYAGLGRLLSEDLINSALFPVIIKLIGALSDIGIGVLLWLTALKLAPPRNARIVLLCWLFNPAVMFISAIWGQLDSLSLLLVFAGIVAMLYGRYLICWTPLSWACLIKPQLMVVLPIVFLVILFRERQSRTGRLHVDPSYGEAGRAWSSPVQAVVLIASDAMRSSALKSTVAGGVVALGVVSLICWPFGVGLLPFGFEWTLLERVQFAMDRHNNMVVGGHTLWSLILGIDAINPDSRIVFSGISVKTIANILTIAALLATYAYCLVSRSWRFTLAWGAAAATVTMYVLPTRIHERYFLPALLFVLLVSVIDPDRRRASLLVVTSTVVFLASLLASYTYAYPVFGRQIFGSPLWMRLLSLGYVVVFAVIVLAGIQRTPFVWRRHRNDVRHPVEEYPVL